MNFLVIQNSDLIFAKILPGRPLRPYLCSQLALMAKMANFQGHTSPRVGEPPFYQFLCAIVYRFFGNPEFGPHFCQNLPRHPLRPYLWRPLALTAKMDHFQGQMSPRAGKPPFYRFSCAIVHRFFGNPKFRLHFCQNSTWTSIKTLSMGTIGPHVQNVPL